MRKDKGEITFMGLIGTKEQAESWVESLNNQNRVAVAALPGSFVLLDEEEVDYTDIELVQAGSVYCTGIVCLGGDRYAGIADADVVINPHALDDEVAVRTALKGIRDEEDEVKKAEGLKKVAGLLTDDGKSALKEIAGRESDNLSELAKLVQAAIPE